MKKKYLICIVLIILSCSSKDKNINVDSAKTGQLSLQRNDTNDFILNTFTNIPNEIDGCSCYFYESKNDENNEKYILVNDFANIAFVSINGSLERFLLKNHVDNSNIYTYENGNFILEIFLIQKEYQNNEASSVKGYIKLSRGKTIVKKEYIGSCGC